MFAIQQYCSFISDFWSIRFKSFTEPHPKMFKNLAHWPAPPQKIIEENRNIQNYQPSIKYEL